MKIYKLLVLLILSIIILNGCGTEEINDGSVACTIYYTSGATSCYGGGSAYSCEQQTLRNDVDMVSYNSGTCN